jgi:DNA-3-methyladenine glycosylase
MAAFAKTALRRAEAASAKSTLRRAKARPLPKSFYERPTLDVLHDIIGKVLVHEVRGRRTAGVIVEAEAYIGEDDPACHAAPGPTKRNAPLYGAPGRAYVYLNYGIHYLVNAVTETEGFPAAILLRALDPEEGIELMAKRRGMSPSRLESAGKASLCRGPGNLSVAMAIGLNRNWSDLVAGPLTVEDRGIVPPALEWTPRVGIRVGTTVPWRCHWAAHPAVSQNRMFKAPRRRTQGE